MKKQQLVAALIFLAVAAWMLVPRDVASTNEEPETSQRTVVATFGDQPPSEDPNVISVRAARIAAQPYVEQIRVRGRTQAFRHVQVRAEQAGRIVAEPVARGARVSAGDVLCEISVDNRQTDLEEATSRREQARFEYEAALDLQRRDLQSDVAVAQYAAALASAEASVSRAELALEKINVIAPFDGVVDSRTVELGDLLNIGDVCASVLDDSPMLLVGLVPEQDVSRVETGAAVHAELVNGKQVEGHVTYVARAADAVSRSYRIEAEVDPGQDRIRDGITAELFVGASEIMAHLIPSSALTLDDNGEIGVKIIGADNRVQFRNVTLVGDNTNQLNPGVWVSGLSGTVTLVTVGQEIVFPGQVVEAYLQDSP